jgi:hypothetical protein
MDDTQNKQEKKHAATQRSKQPCETNIATRAVWSLSFSPALLLSAADLLGWTA